MRAPLIRNLVGGIGLAVALIIAVAVPLGYFAQGYLHLSNALEFKSVLSAGRVAKHVYANERLWQFQAIRLFELIELPNDGEALLRQRIIRADGRLVVEQDRTVAMPVERFRQPIVVREEVVAWLEAETSLRPLLINTAWAAAISSLLGLVAWLTVRLLPLRVLDQTLAKLSMQSVRFEAALDNMTQGLCLFDAKGGLIVHNRRFATMFGVPRAGASATTLLAGTRAGRMFGPPSAGTRLALDDDACDLPDGRIIQVSRQAIPNEGWVATFEDITERRRLREELSRMARHDALSGLPNRLMFSEQMEQLLLSDRGGRMAVLYLDLDGFKGVNDSLGHPVGDEVLRSVAERLRECTRKTDLVVRLGGDEFVVVQADAEQPTEAIALSDRLIEAMRVPFDINGHQISIGTSIGIALADGSATPDALLRNADLALYRAKADGRGAWRFFEPAMDAEMQTRRTLELDLRRALAEGEFEVYYQPLIDATTEKLVGFEALLRWNHPTRGMVLPGEFIPFAEEIGLIRGIGAWVIERACADAAGWPAHVKVAVNLSPVQFVRGNLVREVEQALIRSGLAAARLELEITESVLLQDNDSTLGILHRLRGLGVRISMDDFGTGYSSLNYLRRFPFDKIKIDQSFVRDLGTEKGSLEIIRAVVGLGRALSMEVLAEGVETLEQFRMLQDEGCQELQGYLFSKPMPLRDVDGIIMTYSPSGGGIAHLRARRAAARPLAVLDGRA